MGGEGAGTGQVLSEQQRKLCGILDYLAEITRQSQPKIYSLDQYRLRVFYEHEFKGCVGVKHDCGEVGDPVWLRIERLKRIKPPLPPAELQPWLQIEDEPSKRPTLHDIIVQTMAGREARDLLSTGRVAPDDIALTPRGSSKRLKEATTSDSTDGMTWADEDTVDVVMHRSRFSEDAARATAWIESVWSEWAATEAERRRTISIYENLFSSSLMLKGGTSPTPLELVWGTGIARWKTNKGIISHPIIEKLVELEVDDSTGAIVIRPRRSGPTLALGPYDELEIPTTQEVRKFARAFLEQEGDLPFSPFDNSSFSPVLRKAVTMLDERGSYYPTSISDPTDRTLPPVGTSLTMTDTWAVYLRPKSADYRLQDIEKLGASIVSGVKLTTPAIRLVTEPSDERPRPTAPQAPGAGGGFSMTSRRGETVSVLPEAARDRSADDLNHQFFFPLPFNEEQKAIIVRLRSDDGVVVQGPPGTGKTHTIANIICHMLATGKRVLVTSKGEAALSVLREKIPNNIRDLVIGLLSSEREGLRQVERAIEALASTTAAYKPLEVARRIDEAEQTHDRIRSRIVQIDAELHSYAVNHLQMIKGLDGREDLPWVLAEAVSEHAAKHEWFPDALGLDARFDPKFSDEDVTALRAARILLGKDIRYLDLDLPTPSDLPDAARIAAAHRDLLNAERIAREGKESHRAVLSSSVANAVQRAETLSNDLAAAAETLDTLEAAPWITKLRSVLHKSPKPESEQPELLEQIKLIGELTGEWKELRFFDVEFDLTNLANNEVREAIDRAADHGRPFGLLALGKGAAKQALASVKISGRTPTTQEEWAKVKRICELFDRIEQFRRRWAIVVEELGIPKPAGDPRLVVRALGEIVQVIEAARTLEKQSSTIRAEISALFPFGMSSEMALGSAEGARSAGRDIDANLSVSRLIGARKVGEEIIGKIGKTTAPIAVMMREFARHFLGAPNSDFRASGCCMD